MTLTHPEILEFVRELMARSSGQFPDGVNIGTVIAAGLTTPAGAAYNVELTVEADRVVVTATDRAGDVQTAVITARVDGVPVIDTPSWK